MSYIGNYHQLDPSLVKTLTGDAGGAVPAALNNIDILGGLNIGTVGVIADNKITVNLDLSVHLPNTSSAASGTDEGIIYLGAVAGAGGTVFVSNYGTDNAFFGGSGNRTLTVATAITNNGLGKGALAALTIGRYNSAIGYHALGICTTGEANNVIGYNAGGGIDTGRQNCAFGDNTLASCTAGNYNTALGWRALFTANSDKNVSVGRSSSYLLQTGVENTVVGFEAFRNALTGSYNRIFGANSGSAYVGAESSNIIIGNAGVAAESNTLRIGSQGVGTGQQNRAFVAGIRGVTPATADATVAIIDSLGQLGSLAAGTAGQVLTSNGAAANPTWGATVVTWSVVGASAALVVNTGIICTTGGVLAFSLPAVSAVGDIIEIVLNGSTSWAITQGAAQSIRVGVTTSTVGVGGSLTSTLQGDAIRLVCEVANTSWTALSLIGNHVIV